MSSLNDASLQRLASEMSRRDFMSLLGASMALAGLTGCVREPSEPILPFIHAPDGDAARRYATAMTIDGFATGLLVSTTDGRPIKIEGNPLHPMSLGASSAQHQASLLQLYDPHRVATVTRRKTSASFVELRAALAPRQLRNVVGIHGTGLALLLDPTTSPVTGALISRLRDIYPDASVHFVHAAGVSDEPAAMQVAFGAPLLAHYDYAEAGIVVAFDADPLARGPEHLRQSREFGARKRSGASTLLYVTEVCPSPTGSLADHRLAATPSRMVELALALLHALSADSRSLPAARPAATLNEHEGAWVAAAAQDLAARRGAAIVCAGGLAGHDVHLIVAAINAILGNGGRTAWYASNPLLDAGAASHSLVNLAARATSDRPGAIVVASGNPCHQVPGDIPLAKWIASARTSVALSDYRDDTAEQVEWIVPAAHYLESWDAVRAVDGTLSPVQPLIAPLFSGVTVNELLAAMLGDDRSARTLAQLLAPDAMTSDALMHGTVRESAAPRLTPVFGPDALSGIAPSAAPTAVAVTFPPARAVHDGRFASNAWLQELPDPITKQTWGNALLISPATATTLRLVNGDRVTVGTAAGAAVVVPVLVVPGHADGAGTFALGYGARGDGILRERIGVSAAIIRQAVTPTVVAATVTVAGGRESLALTQTHWSIEGRSGEILDAPPPARTPQPSLYGRTPPGHDGFGADQWAMTIDLDLCTGCSSCVIACQAENNIPVVGKSGVLQSREMHWMRIERYIDANASDGDAMSQPMLCQHCENAPCEYVCPVNATVHSDDGLNEMVYNRCVGTRFCSNNCPYKVRRFNWLNYHDEMTPVDELLANPEVTVRARGVMEKCTFCVQRIRKAQGAAELAGAARTGPVVTACQQSCPTGAIIFGSLTNPDDSIVSSFRDSRAFAALASLNTAPRVRYLARRPRESQSS